MPFNVSLITVLTFFTALRTPFPIYLFLSLSLNSSASYIPVDAPLGDIPYPTLPSDNFTHASTVGFPLESNTSLAVTSSIMLPDFIYALLN